MKLFIFIIVIAVSAASCRSTKEMAKVIQPRDTTANVIVETRSDSSLLLNSTLDDIKKNRIDFTTFSAKLKADVEDKKGKQPDLSAIVRIYKDSAIWISISATFLNIEVYRIFITPDSVILLNKQDKEVQYRSLDFLQEVTAIPFDFATLQDLLVGNPIFFDDEISSLRSQPPYLLVSAVGKYFKHLLTIESDSKVIVHSKLDDVDISRNRTATVSYSDYENINGKPFSTFRHITVAEKNKLDIKLKYKQVEFNKELSVVFNVPKNYTRK